MRKRNPLYALPLAAIALVGILAGCAQPTGDAAGRLAGDWQLVSGWDSAGPLEPGDAHVTLLVDGESAGGRAACNTYSTAIRGVIEDLTIDPATRTEMACLEPWLMELENRYLAALATVNYAEVDVDSLRLLGEGVELQFEPIPPIEAEALAGTRWQLSGLVYGTGPDATVASAIGSAHLILHANGRLEGDGGCRGFEGRYDAHNGEITLGELNVQAADCPGEYVDQEELIITVLENGFRARVEGRTLTLTSMVGSGALEYKADS